MRVLSIIAILVVFAVTGMVAQADTKPVAKKGTAAVDKTPIVIQPTPSVKKETVIPGKTIVPDPIWDVDRLGPGGGG